MRFENQGIVITGAGSGIGRETAIEFAKEGGVVAVTDIDAKAAERTTEEIAKAGGRAYAFNFDTTDPKAVQASFDAIERRLGRLDVLVNSAGIREIVPVLDLDPALWHRVIDINLSGTFHVSQAFARAVKAAGTPAAIINIASSVGLMGAPNRAAYVASKHGVVGLTKSMALDLARYGIRVNAVAPGVVRTSMTESYFGDPQRVRRLQASHPLGREAQPDEIAAVVMFLASADASYMTGSIVPVDGGYSAGKTR